MELGFFSLPMSAGPRDAVVGQDELGRPVRQTVLGQQYGFQAPAQTQSYADQIAAVGRPDPRAQSMRLGDAVVANPDREGLGGADVLAAVQGLVSGALQGVTAPARAARGEPVTYGDVAATAVDWGLMGAPIGAATIPDNSLGIFAGRRAQTADLDALARAEQMAASGASRDDIWANTGWFKGVDGQWRFEIDDSGAGLTDYAQGAVAANRERSGRMPSIMDHEDLDRAYGPLLGEVTVDNSPFSGGAYYPDTGAITARAPTEDALRSTLLHETQHAIQGAEGFAQGSSPGEMFTAHMELGRRAGHHLDAASLLEEVARTGDWDQALKDFSDLGMPVSPEGQDLARRFGDPATARQAYEEIVSARQRMEPMRRPGQWQDDVGFGPYYRTAGEVEARNVQARRDMTPEQRQTTPPWETQDISDADQLIVRGNRLQLSSPSFRAYHGSPHDFNRFSLDHIGTGEGAQAYGHGLYFAENEGVARGYRDALSQAINVNGSDVRYGLDGATAVEEAVRAAGLPSHVADNARWYINRGFTPEQYIADLANDDPSAAQALAGIIRSSDNPGRMYEVQINADPETFLNWDAPLSQQPEAVRQGFENVSDLVNNEAFSRSTGQEFGNRGWGPLTPDGFSDMQGRDAYLRLKDSLVESGWDSSISGASDELRRAGIPGIQYLDAGSRGAGTGTRNFVVFDDSIIDIIRKYGVAGAAPMLGLTAQQLQNEMDAQGIEG